ncbi:FdtA/QdtA family cupin domain-containing protein [Bacteroides sp.]|uniref:sugar 3,4-ketoisomerase n=1 Tax=Bacteroides sp. TaxID=29523 RepID=UPI0026093D90|nr:FdtA/QdtA family cupin domain-containing protein [Bacteroides sp.]
MPKLSDSKIIKLLKIVDPRGNLSIIEQFKEIPFEIKRTYWIYDVPGGCDRGGHAYKDNEEFIIALSGSFDVILDDGENKQTFSLNRSYNGLYVPKGIWRTMSNFSTNSLALVLSSTEYDVNDYIMNYSEFKQWVISVDTKTTPAGYAPMTQVCSMFHEKEAISVFDCSLCQLNKFHDPEGNLTVVSENVHVPFPINRVFYSYDIPGGEDRGAHAHKECHQFIIAASGAFEVVLDDGTNKRTIQMNRPFWGLHVPPGIWASEQGFSSGSICLVLASHGYIEEDYIRNYEDFLKYIQEKNK